MSKKAGRSAVSSHQASWEAELEEAERWSEVRSLSGEDMRTYEEPFSRSASPAESVGQASHFTGSPPSYRTLMKKTAACSHCCGTGKALRQHRPVLRTREAGCSPIRVRQRRERSPPRKAPRRAPQPGLADLDADVDDLFPGFLLQDMKKGQRTEAARLRALIRETLAETAGRASGDADDTRDSEPVSYEDHDDTLSPGTEECGRSGGGWDGSADGAGPSTSATPSRLSSPDVTLRSLSRGTGGRRTGTGKGRKHPFYGFASRNVAQEER